MTEERTAEEREAARLERERRRAARNSGSETSPEPAVAPEAPVEPEPTPPEPEAHVEPPLAERPEPPTSPRRHRVTLPQRPRRAPRAPGRHSRRARVIALLALILAAAIVWFCVELFQPFHGSGHGSVTVVVPAHSHIGQIASQLERDGVISSSFFFEVRATISGDRGDLRAGTYRLKRDMSYSSVLSMLTKAPPAAKVSDVTLIPGRTRRQIDALLRAQGVKGSYYADTRGSYFLRPRWYGAPRRTSSLEGFLFPDTYQLREPISIAALVADQLKRFRQEFSGVSLSYAHSHHLTPYDLLIVASMIEGEAKTARDRGLVASVIYNRLRMGMPLQIDATTCYIADSNPCRLTPALLRSSSPYNTRIHKGLPPTPIDNPSLASIAAAARPARTNYLYFVVQACGNGAEFFTSNYQQFLRTERQYLILRAKRGGRSPAQCK